VNQRFPSGPDVTAVGPSSSDDSVYSVHGLPTVAIFERVGGLMPYTAGSEYQMFLSGPAVIAFTGPCSGVIYVHTCAVST
jgi:hypothetical protein